MNKNATFRYKTLIIIAYFIIFIGITSIPLTISASEEMMEAIDNLTTNEIKETKNEENTKETYDVEIKNTFVISVDKFDILEVEILQGNQTHLINNKKNFNLWNLDEDIRMTIETILK